ncbi:MAG: PKD domain-containing protein [Crocinitomicaceae bacterium]|nr:PKD domain-containing protein [Crocinitomicaceae bacterium]
MKHNLFLLVTSLISIVSASPVNAQTFSDLSVTPAGTITNWSWNFGDGQTSNQQHPDHTYNQSDMYAPSLTITTSDGCQATYSHQIQVVVYPNPIASFAILDNPAQAGDDVFFQDQSTDANNWHWSLGDGTYSTLQNPTNNYGAGSYEIILTSSNEHCVDSTAVILEVEEDLLYYVPNSFTPDGDEFNNTFIPIFTSGFDPADFHLMIFNRWGELIFECFDPNCGWDGTYKGRPVQTGTYAWKIEFGETKTDKRHMINGHVNVLK